MLNPLKMADVWLSDIENEYSSQMSHSSHPSGLTIIDYQKQKITTGRITYYEVPMDHLNSSRKSEIRDFARMILLRKENGYEVRY